MSRVLIVDDEAVNLKMLDRLLTHQGHEVIQARDGQTALDLTFGQSPDLILLDVMMPGMDGFEVCRRIKTDEETRMIPVVMVTALDSLEDKVHGIDVGADDFLTKPYNKLELMARVRSLLKMKRLNDDLTLAYSHLNELNSFADHLFGHFDPAGFVLDDTLVTLLDRLLKRSDDEAEKPEAVFFAFGSTETEVTGNLYRRQGPEVALAAGDVTVPRDAIVGFSDRGLDVAYANWQDVADSVADYQDLLEPVLVELVKPVRNYTAYNSGHVAIMAFNYGKDVGPHDAQVVKALAAQLNFLKTVANQVSEVESAFLYTVESLARAAEAKDEETGNHILRVKAYTMRLAEEMGLDPAYVEWLGYSSMMHDVGKIHIPEGILLKEGPLNDDEWTEMKRHTIYGARILGNHPRLKLARQIAIHHHEKWDGSGYPQGLKGDKISLPGRIVTLGDIYDALRSARSYKPPFSHAKAMDILINGDGRVMPEHFDPEVYQAFKRVAADFETIYAELEDTDD